jgi:sigma-B regulation protein RsbU (phosphoserine phosphatase)
MNERSFPINLESLIELSARLNETHDLQFILNAALLSLMGKLKISTGCVLVADEKTDDFLMQISKGHQSVKRIVKFPLEGLTEISEDEDKFSDLFQQGLRFAQPVRYGQKLLAVICLGKRLLDPGLNDNEILYANLVSSITANAIQIANEHNSLQKIKNKLEYRNLTLTTLFEISREFSALNSAEKIIKLLSLRLMGQLMVNKFAFFVAKSDGMLESVINRCDKDTKQEYINEFTALRSIATRNNEHPDCLKRFFEETEVEVIAPIILQDELKGVLLVGPRMNKVKFSEENLDFIESLGITAITALENERLFRLEIEKKRMENELDLALEIQRGLLPKNFAENERFAIHGFSHPSRFVGGDYYDYMLLPDGKVIFVIADVSGKGMAASLIMANLQSALKVLVSLNLQLDDIVNRLNNVVYDNTAADRFVTFFIGMIDFENAIIQYVNAGHNPPLLFHDDGNYDKLEAENVPLGIFDTLYQYHSREITFSSGDYLVCYTDGITEAQNMDGREFGEDRLIKLIQKMELVSPEKLSGMISESIIEFTAGTHQFDDITCLSLTFK